MFLSILTLTLFSALLATNRKNGSLGGPLLSTIIITLVAILGLLCWFEVILGGSPITLSLTQWFTASNLLNVEWAFTFDSLTASMLIPVLLISALVQLYSLSYMSEDPHKSRFFSYLSLFTFFMLLLITGDNLLVLFVGWEGVGLASYLLINFWFTRIAANMAALKAFLLNRVGDWALTLGLLLILCMIGDVSFPVLFPMGLFLNPQLTFLLTVLFLIGASAKSAQFWLGLNSWLASAMEGPTPVSSLIHAATMVTAGVYILIRLSPLLEWCSNSLLLITFVGGMSALLGAASGLFEYDIKRVIAYSTTSQLGYMVICAGLSQYQLGLFHLINHAFFKALLFLSAGAVLHSISDQQDMRKMGSLNLFLPFSYAGILLGSLSLMAFPFMTGFYSKDVILELALVPYNFTRYIAYAFAILAAFLSAIYSIRLLILTFLSKPNFAPSLLPSNTRSAAAAEGGSTPSNHFWIRDPNFKMLAPLILLSLGAIYFGYLAHDLFLGFGVSNFSPIFTHPSHVAILESVSVPLFSSSTDSGATATPILWDVLTLSILKLLPLVIILAAALVILVPSSFPTSLRTRNVMESSIKSHTS